MTENDNIMNVMGGGKYALLECINRDRSILMGLSIMYVVVYHLSGFQEAKESLSLFRFGYMGVDVFMFLSGYGLCYSYSKNPISTFYRRRMERIYPLWILKAVLFMLLGLMMAKMCTLWDVFCNLTTLYYLGLGGTIHDWYIPAILIIYLLFPLLYHTVRIFKTKVLLLLAFVNVLIFSILRFWTFDWSYDCFIARIPMVFMGVATYFRRDDKYFLLTAMALQSLFLIPSILYGVSGIYRSLCWAPTLMLVMIALTKLLKMQHWIYATISWVGDHTLEIYLAHSFTFVLIPEVRKIYSLNFSTLLLAYFSITMVMSLMFIKIDKTYKKTCKLSI